jgi:phage shock protein C
MKKLYKSSSDKIIGGVCGGLGDYLGIEPIVIRVIAVILALIYGTGFLAYAIAWILIPAAPSQEIETK